MNRKNLTAAVLAGLAGVAGIVGTAQAVNINPDGLGQVLIYPYYTTNGGNATILSVVNTTGEAKAVKVRFLEGMNSREVLDFNLYMSAYDVWAAAVLIVEDKDGNLVTGIEVNDTTCSVPYLYQNLDKDGFRDGRQSFLTHALTDGGPKTAARIAEGHFEMIEMGTLTGSSANAATHVNGVPGDSTNSVTDDKGPCEQLLGAWTFAANPAGDGYWTSNALVDITAPSGGLFGGAGIINVKGGALYAYDALAINNWTQSRTSDGSDDIVAAIHSAPGNIEPSLGSGDQLTGTIFLSTPVKNAIALPNMGAFTQSIDAVSYTLMRDTVMNEFSTEASLQGKTEWVVTFPTKNEYVDPARTVGVAPRAPFTTAWGGEKSAKACETVALSIWDREERVEEGTSTGPVVSPEEPELPGLVTKLCYETNVIQFNAGLYSTPSTLLGSSRLVNIDNVNELGFDSGWMKISFGTADPANNLGGLLGLPVTGFRLSEFTNMDIDGQDIKGTYGGLWQHKYTRLCSADNSLGTDNGCAYPKK